MSGRTTLLTVERGQQYVAENVKSPWVGVEVRHEGDDTTGWILDKDLVHIPAVGVDIGLTLGQVLDDADWQMARTENTPEAYARYLNKHGEGRFAEVAVWRLIHGLADTRSEKAVDAIANQLKWRLSDVGESILPHLMIALEHSDPIVRYRVAVLLSRIDELWWLETLEPRMRAELKAAFAPHRQEPNTQVIMEPVPDVAAFALPIAGEKGRETLIGLLQQDHKGEQRIAAEALGHLKDPKSVEPLIALLKNGSDDARWHATRVLGEIKDRRAVDPLIDALQGKSQRVQVAAAKGLGKQGDARAVEPLIEMLARERGWVLGAAGEALAELKNKRAVEPLLALLEQDEQNPVHVAADTLAAIGDPRAAQPILSAYKDGKLYQAKAVECLSRLGPGAIELLEAELQNAVDSRHRYTTARTICNIESNQDLGRVIARLRDSDWHIREAAAEVLGTTKDDRAVTALISALRDEHSAIRESAAWGLGAIGSPQAVEPLMAVLGDSSDGVRRAAAWSLGRIGEARASTLLLQRLGTEDRQVQRVLAGALACLDDKRAVRPLADRLTGMDTVFISSSHSHSDINRTYAGDRVAALICLGWRPKTHSDVVHLVDLQLKVAIWRHTYGVLRRDLQSSHAERIEAAAGSAIELGKTDFVPILITALNRHGTKELAETYLNSKNQRLAAAAQSWGARNGLGIQRISGSSVGPTWPGQ